MHPMSHCDSYLCVALTDMQMNFSNYSIKKKYGLNSKFRRKEDEHVFTFTYIREREGVCVREIDR